MFIPVNEPTISEESKKNVISALDSGWISSSGSFVNEFEEKFAERFGIKHAITVTNGTAALHVALLSLGIKEGDEVIVPAFTMAASWMAIMYTGAKPVFVDCELETYNIDTNKIEEKITEKTKAIMPVHIYGHPCDMDPIMNIAKKHNLFVVEDAAEAHGATYNEQLAGTIGDIGCFSFYGNKIITTGEGGMIITNNDLIAKKCRQFKDLHHSETRFIHDGLGYNYRMTNLQAALGCGELKKLDEYVEKKIWIAERYNELLKDIPGITIPTTKTNVKNVFWMYSLLIDKKEFGMDRDSLRGKLKENEIGTRDFFYSPEDQPILKDILNNKTFPNTRTISEQGLYLPSGLAITEEQIEKVGKIILELSTKIQ